MFVECVRFPCMCVPCFVYCRLPTGNEIRVTVLICPLYVSFVPHVASVISEYISCHYFGFKLETPRSSVAILVASDFNKDFLFRSLYFLISLTFLHLLVSFFTFVAFCSILSFIFFLAFFMGCLSLEFSDILDIGLLDD